MTLGGFVTYGIHKAYQTDGVQTVASKLSTGKTLTSPMICTVLDGKTTHLTEFLPIIIHLTPSNQQTPVLVIHRKEYNHDNNRKHTTQRNEVLFLYPSSRM